MSAYSFDPRADRSSHYGKLNYAQQSVVTTYVRGCSVTDLGAYQLEHSRQLLAFGAHDVIAVDRLPATSTNPRIRCVRRLFENYHDDILVAFVSWPYNGVSSGLLRCIERAAKIIVLSKNTDGTVCGWPELYRHLITRKLLAYEPDRANCLIVVGETLKKPRKPTGEERAGIENTGPTILSYDEAERA